jgi:dephospho-CoA kinase
LWNIDTFFLPSRQDLAHISSGAAKALQLEQGLIHEYVPLNVKQQLEERLSGQYIVGITGEIGAGKTYISSQLIELGNNGIPVHRIDLDSIGHEILEKLTEPLFVKIREQIAIEFGPEVKGENGFINRKALGKIIFSDASKLDKFNTLIYKPLLLRLRRTMYGKRGLIILDSALLAESRMNHLCNNNVILVDVSKENQLERLYQRGYSEEQENARIRSQYPYKKKLSILENEIRDAGYGTLYHCNNTGLSTATLVSLLNELTIKVKFAEHAQ